MKDYKKIKFYAKKLKQARFKKFSNGWYKRVRSKYYIKYIKEQCCYVIYANNEIYRYFPKTNKILVDSSREWLQNANKFIQETLLGYKPKKTFGNNKKFS